MLVVHHLRFTIEYCEGSVSMLHLIVRRVCSQLSINATFITKLGLTEELALTKRLYSFCAVTKEY